MWRRPGHPPTPRVKVRGGEGLGVHTVGGEEGGSAELAHARVRDAGRGSGPTPGALREARTLPPSPLPAAAATITLLRVFYSLPGCRAEYSMFPARP